MTDENEDVKWDPNAFTREKREKELKKHQQKCDHLRERLWTAVDLGDPDEVFLVVRKVEQDESIESMIDIIEPVTADGVTPAYTACKNGHLECAKTLINAGASAGKQTKSRKLTPLFIAAQQGHAECVEFLLRQRDVRVNHQTKDGRTALYAACEGGNTQCVQLLIDAGGHIDLTRDDKSTPLITAAYYGRDAVVEVLLAAGAKLLPRDSDGNALENARRQKHARCVELLENAMKERAGLEALAEGQGEETELY